MNEMTRAIEDVKEIVKRKTGDNGYRNVSRAEKVCRYGARKTEAGSVQLCTVSVLRQTAGSDQGSCMEGDGFLLLYKRLDNSVFR